MQACIVFFVEEAQRLIASGYRAYGEKRVADDGEGSSNISKIFIRDPKRDPVHLFIMRRTEDEQCLLLAAGKLQQGTVRVTRSYLRMPHGNDACPISHNLQEFSLQQHKNVVTIRTSSSSIKFHLDSYPTYVGQIKQGNQKTVERVTLHNSQTRIIRHTTVTDLRKNTVTCKSSVIGKLSPPDGQVKVISAEVSHGGGLFCSPQHRSTRGSYSFSFTAGKQKGQKKLNTGKQQVILKPI